MLIIENICSFLKKMKFFCFRPPPGSRGRSPWSFRGFGGNRNPPSFFGSFLASKKNIFYDFMAPNIIPLVKYFCTNGYTNIIGKVVTIMVAICTPGA